MFFGSIGVGKTTTGLKIAKNLDATFVPEDLSNNIFLPKFYLDMKTYAFKSTVEDFYKNIVVIGDKYGAAANIIMRKIRETALERGYEIITLKNPFLPSKKNRPHTYSRALACGC